MNIILAKNILRILLYVLCSVDGTIAAGRNHDNWIERNVRTCFCALDSNDAWNGFQGGTLDSSSLSKNISHRVKLKNKKIHFAVCTLAVGIFVFNHSIS